MLVVLVACGYAFEATSYFTAIVLHEMCHAALAAKLGYTLNQMRLMPYGAGLTGEFEGIRNRDEVAIALVGPLSNVAIAVCVIALWWLFPSVYTLTEIFVYANIFTAVVNLIPLFPLDGGRALLAICSMRFDRSRVYKIMRIIGGIIAVVLCAMSVILYRKVNFSFMFMSVFILLSTIIPDKRSKYERLYSMAYRRDKIEKGLPIRSIMVSQRISIYKMFRMLKSDVYTNFTVVDDRLSVVAHVSENDLESLCATLPHNISIQQAKNL